MNKNFINYEFDYLKKFAKGIEYFTEIDYNQLKSLWTAFCFHSDLIVDTSIYDNKFLEIWEEIESTDGFDFTYGDFYNFMCEYLV